MVAVVASVIKGNDMHRGLRESQKELRSGFAGYWWYD
jgi:hypothetical protein